jgi:GNAT superfamily N-acetyltransferase
VEQRPYQPGDEISIRELFRLSFGQEMPAAFWEWRFLDNPAAPRAPLVSLMWDGATLAGHYAVSPCTIRLDGRDERAALSMTTMTHPDYRGRGIFTELASSVYREMSEQGSELVFGFPNEASHASFIRQLAWNDVYEIPMLAMAVEAMAEEGEHVTTIDRFSDSDLLFAAAALSGYDAYVRRDAAYLNWRYVDHPVSRYTRYAYRGPGGVGYAVCKIHATSSSRECDLVDLVTNGREPTDALIRQTNRFAREQGADRINLWLNRSHPQFALLERGGFVHGAPVTWFGYRGLGRSAALPRLRWFDAWYLTMGDSDVY